MLLLPSCQSNHHFIFFGKIIIELFRKQTKIWPRVVGPIINKMFHEIENIDIECRDRLIEWFSFHLANFNFQWPWENWSNVVNLYPISSPKTSFIYSIMIKCLHLSYYDRFKKTLPINIINKILPNKPDGNYLKKYQINDICSNLLRLLNQRQSPEDIVNHLEKYVICDQIDKEEYQDQSDSQIIIYKQIHILFTCILHVGKSSCSHVLSFLKMYGKKPLKQLLNNTPNKYGQFILLSSLFEYWINSPIRIEILSDKLHAMNYIEPQIIIKYIFKPENKNIYKLYKQIYWIMIKQSIDRIVKTTQGMKRGIDKFKNDIKQLNKNLNSDFNDQEMTIITKQNKQKQLNQLQLRLNNTQENISNVFILFFKLGIDSLYYLIDNEYIVPNNNDNEQEEEEQDDDMLMSEQFIAQQEKIDKEKEKAAILKSRESNINKYIFKIITSRMIEIARKFHKNINENTWNILQNDIFTNTKNDNNDNENIQKITQTIKHIVEIRDLL